MSKAGLEVEAIGNALKAAAPYKLQCEIVWNALKNMQMNPKITVEEAMAGAMCDWDIL